MKIELKKLQTYARQSEETTAYNAELWVDGAKVADCANNGQGEADRIYWTERGRSVADQLKAHVKAMPPRKWEDGTTYPMDLELLIGQLIEEEQTRKYVKRASLKSTLFRLPGDGMGEFRKLNTPDREKARAYLSNKYGTEGFTLILP